MVPTRIGWPELMDSRILQGSYIWPVLLELHPRSFDLTSNVLTTQPWTHKFTNHLKDNCFNFSTPLHLFTYLELFVRNLEQHVSSNFSVLNDDPCEMPGVRRSLLLLIAIYGSCGGNPISWRYCCNYDTQVHILSERDRDKQRERERERERESLYDSIGMLHRTSIAMQSKSIFFHYARLVTIMLKMIVMQLISVMQHAWGYSMLNLHADGHVRVKPHE